MKKLIILLISFSFLIGCQSKRQETKTENITLSSGLLNSQSQKDTTKNKTQFELIPKYEVDKLISKDDSLNLLVTDFNAKNAKNSILFNSSKFEISIAKLNSFIQKIPKNGYLFCELGIKEKKKLLNKNIYSGLNMKLSIRNEKYESVENDSIVFNGFDDNSKSNLYEAYKLLSDYGIKHFDTSKNLAGVIFRKDSSEIWLSNKNLDQKVPLTITKVSEDNISTLIISGTTLSKNIIFGNRGSSCCPPAN